MLWEQARMPLVYRVLVMATELVLREVVRGG